MAKVISASFAVRRDADMAIERLVQEHGIAPDAINVQVASADNSSGTAPGGGDLDRGKTEKPRLAGRLVVSVAVDEAKSEDIRSTLRTYYGKLDPA